LKLIAFLGAIVLMLGVVADTPRPIQARSTLRWPATESPGHMASTTLNLAAARLRHIAGTGGRPRDI
jgi:hypothetical protein